MTTKMSSFRDLAELYTKLNEELTRDEEKKILHLLVGNQLNIKESQKLNDVTEILLCLENKGFISEDDLTLVKDIIKAINRRPLLKHVKKCEDALQKRKKQASEGETENPQLGKATQLRHRQGKQKDYSSKTGDDQPDCKVHQEDETDQQDSDEFDGPKRNENQEAKTQRTAFWKFGIVSMIFLVCVLAYICIPSRQENTNITPSPEPKLEDDEPRLGHKELWNTHDNDKENMMQGNRSVLFLNDEWGTSKGGISSVNRQLALQAKAAGYAVYVTVLDRPSQEDQKDAAENGINLIIADTIPSLDPKVNLKMVNEAHQRYFPSLEKDITNLNVIVGHVPITSKGAIDIKQKRFPKAKVYLFTHVIPQDTDFHRGRSYKLGDIETKVDTIIQQAEQADLIFSVGPKVYKKFKNEFRGSEVNDDKHKELIPIPDSRFFDLDLKPFEKDHAYEILTVGRVSNVENLKGYDIVAAALGKVATRSNSVIDGLLWRIRGISEEDKDESLAFIKKHLKSVNGNLLDIYPLQYGSQEQITKDIQKSRLFLMPSRTEPFGMVGLEAMAAGIPVLVTANSGLADFLKEHFPKHMHDPMIVSKLGKTDTDTDADIDIWVNRVTDVLLNKYDDTFDLARQVKGKLTKMKSHQNSQIFKEELKKLK